MSSRHEEAIALIKRLSPLLDEESEVFRELAVFFGHDAKIEVHHGDLSKFLGRKRLYRVIRLSAENFKACAYRLVDEHPEAMDALGMLRYYKASAPIRCEEIENAEIALGKELTMGAYGWAPDAWTAFESDGTENGCEMVAILAFDFGD
jgi:hypothetical protein